MAAGHNTQKVLVLVEGQSEERFVKDILFDHLAQRNVYLAPKILTTRVVRAGPNNKGGLNSFSQFERDLRLLLRDSSATLVTSIIDLYRLPSDFPGYGDAQKESNYSRRVAVLREALIRHFSSPAFEPYLSVHEYEALTLVAAEPFFRIVPPPHEKGALIKLCQIADLEAINNIDSPATRIRQLAPSYSKLLHGSALIGTHGLAAVRARCQHFHAWLSKLEGLAEGIA